MAENIGSVGVGIELDLDGQVEREIDGVFKGIGKKINDDIAEAADITVFDKLEKEMQHLGEVYENTEHKLALVNEKLANAKASLAAIPWQELDGSEEALKFSSSIANLEGQSIKLRRELEKLDEAVEVVDQKMADASAKGPSLLSRAMDRLRNVFSKSEKPVQNSSAGMLNFSRAGRSIARNLVGISFAVSLASRAFSSMANYVGGAMMQNDTFKKSLEQVRSNLATAFQPILTAITPALNALMSILIQVSGVIAGFMNSLFGTSVADSGKAAKAISGVGKAAGGAAKEMRKVAGFDQLNDMTEDKNAGGGGGGAGDKLDFPEPDVSAWEKWQGVIDNIMNDLRPLGEMLKTIWDLIIVPAAQTVWDVLVLAFGGLWEIIKQLQPVFDAITKSLQKNEKVTRVLGAVVAGVALLIMASFAPVTALFLAIGALFNLMWDNSETFRTIVTEAMKGVGAAIEWLFDTAEALIDGIIWAFNNAGDIIPTAMRAVGEMLKTIWKGIQNTWNATWSAIGKFFTDRKNDIVNGVNGLKTAFMNIVNWVKGAFVNTWNAAWNAVSNGFKRVFNGLVNIAKVPINALIRLLNGFLSGLNRIKIPSWVPGLGGMGFNIPKIPALADGGVVRKPTVALVGEYAGASRNPEIVSPQQLMEDVNMKSLERFFAGRAAVEPISEEQVINLTIEFGGMKFAEQVIQLLREYGRATGKAVLM